MTESKIRLHEDLVVASCGAKKQGSILTESECGESWEWILEHIRHSEVTDDEIESEQSPVDAVDEVESEVAADVVESDESPSDESSPGEGSEEVDSPDSETTVVADGDVLEKLKSLLSDKKSRMDDLVEDSGFSEEALLAVLTEANGFHKNQQGWWGIVKS